MASLSTALCSRAISIPSCPPRMLESNAAREGRCRRTGWGSSGSGGARGGSVGRGGSVLIPIERTWVTGVGGRPIVAVSEIRSESTSEVGRRRSISSRLTVVS